MQPKSLLLPCCPHYKPTTCLFLSLCILLFTRKNTDLIVVVVGVSLMSCLHRLRRFLVGWFSIHVSWNVCVKSDQIFSKLSLQHRYTIPTCFPRKFSLSQRWVHVALLLSLSTASRLWRVRWFMDVHHHPPSPDTPTLCFVRVPTLLYLTFWTKQDPEIVTVTQAQSNRLGSCVCCGNRGRTHI